MVVPAAPVAMTMPDAPLLAMTLRSSSVSPPMTLPDEPPSMRTPCCVLPRAVVPSRPNPMRLPAMTLLSASFTQTPLPVLPEMTLPSTSSSVPSPSVPMRLPEDW